MNQNTPLTDAEKIIKLRALASQLDIRIHLASMDFSDKAGLSPTKTRNEFGIVFVDNVVGNDTAFYLQQHRHDNGRTEKPA